MADCSDFAIGKRIKQLRNNYKKNGKRLSQEQFAKKLGYSREQVAKWETGKQSLLPDQLNAIATFFGVSIDKLVTDTASENRSIASETGLTDDSIEYLKNINANRDVFFLDSVYDSDFVGMVDGEGNSNLLVLKTLNLILSTNCGCDLLQAIGNFCFGDFDNGFPIFDEETPDNKIAPVDSSGHLIPADSIRFNVNGIREGCNISMDLMKFALMKAVENYISVLRDIAKGDE